MTLVPNTWDEGQICLPGCLSRMNENNWEKACCGAMKNNIGNDKGGTHCMVQGVNTGLDRPGFDGMKGVQCKGTLNCFQIWPLEIEKIIMCNSFLKIKLFY